MCGLSQSGVSSMEDTGMFPDKSVPDIVIGRLPIYLRALAHLEAEGQRIIASKDLAKRLGMSSAQIRKDLSHFGEFGKQGMGYDVTYLREQLRSVLNIDRRWEVALVGAGDLGHAIAYYGGFEGRGFQIACVFDNNPQKVGRRLGRFEILDAADLPGQVKDLGIKIAIVAVPANAAQAVVDELIAGGVKAILNYAPITVTVPLGIHVQYIDPVVHLQRMSYYLD
jgi:redox-sensing transcriptional repressor